MGLYKIIIPVVGGDVEQKMYNAMELEVLFPKP